MLKTSFIVTVLFFNFCVGSLFPKLSLGDQGARDENKGDFIACYDYSAPISAPLRSPFDKEGERSFNGEALKKTTGMVNRGSWSVHWAAVQKTAPIVIDQVIKRMHNHKVTMSSSVDEYTEESSRDQWGQLIHKVDYLIKPFPLVRIRWTERWIYSVLRGTERAPQTYHAAYQKIAGTSHIEHLCGSILAESMPTNGRTKITVIEETRATRTDAEETLKGVINTITALSAP